MQTFRGIEDDSVLKNVIHDSKKTIKNIYVLVLKKVYRIKNERQNKHPEFNEFIC